MAKQSSDAGSPGTSADNKPRKAAVGQQLSKAPIAPPISGDRLSPDELAFDRHNPRLAEHGIKSNASDDDIIKKLWEVMDVSELVQSIAASGFFDHEPLVVAHEAGKNVVIEGNRRLVAVKLLLDRRLAIENGWAVPKLPEQELQRLKLLPIFRSSREDSWRFVGFKHVNGPAKWSSYAKAKYIADVHKKYKVPLAQIAEQIGDGFGTVERLHKGLMVLRQAKAAGVYDIDDRQNSRLAFSHLYTGLGYDGFLKFLGVTSLKVESETPIPKSHVAQLGELLTWLYGSKKQKVNPIIASQNPDLRNLDLVLRSKEGLSALRAHRDLTRAHEASRPAGTVFEEALTGAKRSLQKARGLLTDGFDNSEAQLGVAESIANMASDMVAEMRRKLAEAGKK